MILTPAQLSSARRTLEEIADVDAKKQVDVFVLFDLSVQLVVLHDGAVVAVDEAARKEVGRAGRFRDLSDEQSRLLRLLYIRRRIGIEIDRLEERAIDLRVEDEP